MKKKAHIKNIIVGVDFSRYSNVVVRQARAIAKHLKAPLVFVYVFKEPATSYSKYPLLIKSLTQRYARRIQIKYSISGDEKVFVKSGHAYEQIIDVASKFHHPFIVVGHRGENKGLSRFLIGSTAERLALHSPYPVLVQKGNKIVLPKKILVPFEFTAKSKHAIEGAKNLHLIGADIELFHVQQLPVPTLDYFEWEIMSEELEKINEKEVKKVRQAYAPLKVSVTKSNDVVGQIRERSKKFDMIAISPRQKKGMFASFGSVTSAIVRAGQTPVLVVP